MNGCPVHFDPLSPQQLRDPYPIYTQLRTEAPVFHDPQRDLWIVTRYDDVEAVARDPETFSSENAVRASVRPLPGPVLDVLSRGWPLSPTITDSDGDTHSRLRSLVSRVFSPKLIAAMEEDIRSTVDDLIDEFVTDGRADIIDRFAWMLPLYTVTDMLGINREDSSLLHRWSVSWLRIMQATDTVNDLIACAHDVVNMQKYFMRALKSRRDKGDDDFMSSLLRTRRGGDALTMVEAMRVPMNLIIAGHVTVTRSIGNGLHALLNHPDQLAAVREDPSLVPTMIEEILRYESPAQGLFRTVTRDTVLNGTAIPAGAHLMVHWGSANRDPSAFDNAGQFDISRDSRDSHVAFGKGIHACLGSPLARLQLQIAIPRLIKRLPNLRLVDDGQVERDTVFFARGFTHLELAWDPPKDAVRPAAEDLLKVTSKGLASDGVVVLTLESPEGGPLPPWKPGAHADLELGNGLRRQYSLCGDPDDRSRLRIAVYREAESRGGSAYIHEQLQVGDVARMHPMRNNFALAEAPRYLFIAGGIGITPLLPMLRHVERAKAEWRLVYGGRSRQTMAFLDEVERYGDRVHVVPQDVHGLLDIKSELEWADDQTLVYCCGPSGLLRAVEEHAEDMLPGRLHVERFRGEPLSEPVWKEPFEVYFERSGVEAIVNPDQSIIEVAEDFEIPVIYACSEGTCGTCLTKVLDGAIDHRDSFLKPAEREAGDRMMICVSRSAGPRICLDA